MARAAFALCSKCRFRAWAWHARRSRLCSKYRFRAWAWLRPVVYSRETAAATTIVPNSTTYDAKVTRLTCFVVKQGKATIRQRPTNQSRVRANWLRAGNRLRTPLWETLWLTGLTVSKLTFSLRAASTADL